MIIKEDYVSYEVAKLLQEKGFGIVTSKVYDNQHELDYQCTVCWQEERLPYVYAPTLQMAMKWLREVHNIFIQVELYSKFNDYCFEVFENTHRMIVEKDEVYNTYEQAVEEAIKYCLENLIK